MKQNMQSYASGQMSVKVQRMERRELGSGGHCYTAVPNGVLSAEITLYLDVNAIMRKLGAKALKSKSRKSKALSGAVEVRVTSEDGVCHSLQYDERLDGPVGFRRLGE